MKTKISKNLTIYARSLPFSHVFHPYNLKSSGSTRSKRKYEVLIGTRTFMFENSIVVSDNVETTMQSHEGKGRTSVLVAIDSKYI